MIDIDFFKSVNDTFGHDAGDAVLRAVSETMHKSKRSSDIAGRLGGEEFALVLPEATPDRAMAAAERYRSLIGGRPVIAKGRQISVTVSVGVSIAEAGMAGFDELLKRADIALYEAKNSGRNRVCRFAAQPA
jgi:diguanylate cyclase (GGDEF)-like protein